MLSACVAASYGLEIRKYAGIIETVTRACPACDSRQRGENARIKPTAFDGTDDTVKLTQMRLDTIIT